MIKLREYQENAKNAAIKSIRDCGGAGLFMDAGTGKSLTALSVMVDLGLAKACVVCPKSLIDNFKYEIKKSNLFEKPFFLTLSNAETKKKRWIKSVSDFEKSEIAFLFIAVEFFQGDCSGLKKAPKMPTMLIVDEVSKFKSAKSQRTKNFLQVAPGFKARLILTGTDIDKTPMPLYSEMRIVKNDIWRFKNYFLFENYFCEKKKIVLRDSGREISIITGFRNIDEIHKTISPYIVRCKKADCLDLPDKVFEPIYCEYTEEQAKIIHDLKHAAFHESKDGRIDCACAAVLYGKIRQVAGGLMCDSPKLDILKDKLEEIEQAVIFACYTEEIKSILEVLGRDAAGYYGEVPQEERTLTVEKFQRGDIKYLVANPACAGMGLNLQNCNTVFYYSLPLSVLDYSQSQDRIHRSGQDKTCFYYPILCGALDEKIYKSLEKQENFIDSFKNGISAIDEI